jgi:hypothetical protein
MAKRSPEPVTLSVVRRGKTFTYELADQLDWGVLYDVLIEIKSTEPAGKFYWPLDSVTLWKVEPRTLSGHA